jgi:ATP-binding cassette subfamily B protein
MYVDIKLWRLTIGLRGQLVWAALLGLLGMLAGIGRIAFLALLLAKVFARGAPGDIVAQGLGAAACVLAKAGLERRRTDMANRTAGRLQTRLRQRLHDKIVELGPAWAADGHTGALAMSVTDGVEQLHTFFGQYLPQLFVAAAAPLVIFAAMTFWDLPIAGVLLAAALFSLVAPIAIHRLDCEAALARRRAFKNFSEEFLDAIQGLPTLKALGYGVAHGRMLAAKATALSQTTFWVLALGLLTRGAVDLGTGIGFAGAVVLAGVLAGPSHGVRAARPNPDRLVHQTRRDRARLPAAPRVR